MEVIDHPGIYEIPMADYQADPCPEPSLSSHIAHRLLSQSPWHAWMDHPRLNPAYRSRFSDAFDLGTATHALVLEGTRGVEVIQATDWRTKEAKAARDTARAEGRVALLADQWARVVEAAKAINRQLDDRTHERRLFDLGRGKPEETLIWREGDVWCRARPDWRHHDGLYLDDLKTTQDSANPEKWTRGPLWWLGYDVQAAFYLRGLEALTGETATFRFCVVELWPPYALSVVSLAPDALALAHKKVDAAIKLWRECRRTDRWPGYTAETCYAEAPPWELVKWEQRTYQTPVVDDGRPLVEQLFGGQP